MNKNLSIAHFSDSFYPIIGGREFVIDNLLSHLTKNKIQTFLATTTFKGHKEFINDKLLPYEVIRCKSIRITKNEYLSIINKKFKKIINSKIENNQIDIIHTHTKYSLLNYAFKLRKKYNIPVVTTVHTNYLEQYKHQLKIPFVYNILLKRVKKVINKTDHVFTVSNTMKDILIKWGIQKPITVIPNGVNLEDCNYSKKIQDEIKTKYNLNNTNNILLYVGRIVNTKNINLLLESIQLLKQKNKSFKVLLVGSGNINKYKKLAAKLKIEDQCVFTGPITNKNILYNIYSLSDILLSPSTIETFGLTIYEAAKAKTPSIVIENCATSEFIKHNYNGFITNANPINFSNTIINVLENSDNLISVGDTANKTLDFSWDIISQKYIDEYKKIKCL